MLSINPALAFHFEFSFANNSEGIGRLKSQPNYALQYIRQLKLEFLPPLCYVWAFLWSSSVSLYLNGSLRQWNCSVLLVYDMYSSLSICDPILKSPLSPLTKTTIATFTSVFLPILSPYPCKISYCPECVFILHMCNMMFHYICECA